MASEINYFQLPESNPKKRVLFVITQSESGGAQQFLSQFLGQLQKNNYDIHVAMGIDGDGSLVKQLNTIGISHYTLTSLRRNISPFSDIKAVWEIHELIRGFQPDTLFLLSSKAGFIGSLAARLSSIKPNVVYRIGGWSFNDPGPTWKHWLWIYLERLSAPWKDIIIINNTHDLKQAHELHIRPRKSLNLVYNGIDPYKLSLLPSAEARQMLLETIGLDKPVFDGKIIGTIANFYPAKGLEYLIEAFSLLNTRPTESFGQAKYLIRNTRLLIIGDGNERNMLEKLIRQRGLEDKVFLLGQRMQASQYLSAFDIFVLPSVKEGYPWSVLEAMSAKLPIIATRVGAIPEIIENGLNGYIVEPANPEQIADNINLLLTNESLAKEMGIQAHQTVLFKFTLDKMIKQIEELL